MSLADTGAAPPPGSSALAKLRRNNKGLANASTASLPNTSSESDTRNSGENASDDGRLRASLDAAIDKVKERTSRRSSADARSGNEEAGRLSTLLSKTKRKIKKSDRDDNDASRRNSVNSALVGQLGNRSESSLLAGSGHSSLLTDDERVDSEGNPIRPSLSPHLSHAGLLTLSSPELNQQASPIRAEADAVHSSGAASSADPSVSIPHIVEPTTVDTIPPPAGRERSPSPVNKLRGAFPLSRKKSGGLESVKSTGSGSGGFGGLFRPSSRRNSLSSRPNPAPHQSEQEETTEKLEGEVLSVREQAQDRPQTPKSRVKQPLDTSIPATPPNPVDAPTTFITPPTPTDFNGGTFSRSHSPDKGSPKPPSSVESIRQRRAQSAIIPSKLSTSVTAPLTPTVEETKTPGGTLTQPNAPGGFFGFFSAAQKASVQFSNSISSSILPNQKSKPGSTVAPEIEGGEEVIPGVGSRPGTGVELDDKQPLAVGTLGKGNLSFSHLGISESRDTSPMTSTTDLPQTSNQMQNGDSGRKAEEEAAARAVSSAYEKPIVNTTGGRPLSIASNERHALNGDQTPPRAPVDPESNNIKRSGSVRSKLSGRRKHRGSSATAGTTNSIAAALRDTTTGLANPSVHGAGHRLTGFAVASSKRNKDFHQLFRSVPEDDYLIEDYSAALQRDILLHGRLYVSEGHICFSSNILGWVTNLVISFDEVVSVEKKSTAVIFPNAIVISTLHARNTFASFVARDSTYELLIGIWKISHPNLKSSLNGVTLDDAGTGDKTEVAEPASEGETEDGTEDEVYDEDADDDAGSFTDGGLAASVAGSEMGDMPLSRKPSGLPISFVPQANGLGSQGLEAADAVVTGAAVSSDFPGAPAHDPTQCSDAAEHYDKPLTDTTIPAPLGKVYSIMFGPASGAFMRKWLVEDQKSRDLNYVDDKTGLDNEHTSFTFDYIKPLTASVGPRQTKCITTNTLKAFDLEKAVSIDCSTQTPDVPSGNVFTTKTRYCLMWGPGNSTRLIASCTVEWTGKSWLKGPIEKGAENGQIEYVNHIVTALKAAVTTKPPVKGMPRKGKRKGKKEVFDAEEAITHREAVVAAEQKSPDWGVLQPVHQLLEILIALVRPFITSQVMIAVLSVLLAYTWFFQPRGGTGVGYPGYSSPDRIAAYEEIWRREESALWDWLEDRVGVDGGSMPPLSKAETDRQKVLRAQGMGKQLENERMSEREMDEQIRSTEEKLAALKEAVGRNKAKRRKTA
ncbi:gram domain-containing [Lecanosticta acicola]|uniref:Gram domain-containing n=1 Tax=Lecanosticta acicola TaxID=111012 RepID=A0AAI8YZB0_9PEZI|nr:gram domain-containing [Lecanosticta acicola]